SERQPRQTLKNRCSHFALRSARVGRADSPLPAVSIRNSCQIAHGLTRYRPTIRITTTGIDDPGYRRTKGSAISRGALMLGGYLFMFRLLRARERGERNRTGRDRNHRTIIVEGVDAVLVHLLRAAERITRKG